MTDLFGLVCRATRRRTAALLAVLALSACDGTERLVNSSDDSAGRNLPATLSISSTDRTGIPFGVFHLPNSAYGSIYTGALRTSSPASLLATLEAARQAGARVVLSFVGAHYHYQNSDKSFSLDKWKRLVDPFRGIDFSSYIADGTVIGHYLFDEPHDPSNWGGRTVPPSLIDDVAKYSKQLWPTMPTIVRGWPSYLKGYHYQYLDVAWAQYSERFGSAATFIADNVRDAKAAGLGLIVGMNILDGGTKASGIPGTKANKYSMSGSQLLSWGTTLLADPYLCGFISWQYDQKYLSRSDIGDAMQTLSGKARQHASRSCATGLAAAVPPSEPLPVPPDDQQPPPVVDSSAASPPVVEAPVVDSSGLNPPVVNPPVVNPPANPPPVTQPTGQAASPSRIKLSVSGRVKGKSQYMTLTWSGVSGSTLDVYRDGALLTTTANDRRYTNVRNRRAPAYAYKICERRSTTRCSNTVNVTFR